MIYAFCALCFVACFGFIYAYCLGIKHGRVVSNGGQPKMPDPVKAVIENAERKAEQKKAEHEDDEFFQMLGSINQETMLQHIKSERAKGHRV